MTEPELEELAASVTPERLRQLVLDTPGSFQLKKRIVITAEALVKELLRGREAGEGLQYQHVASRLLRAIRQAAAACPGAVQSRKT
ncbi:MAG: hypothetical protein BWY10_02040 [Chloroflexi bacterium ADurb.Bin180]|nr:MAG: hypothetical protein BWY10_02040 [Chloroflexi bacterium ADurb.Bin180]